MSPAVPIHCHHVTPACTRPRIWHIDVGVYGLYTLVAQVSITLLSHGASRRLALDTWLTPSSTHIALALLTALVYRHSMLSKDFSRPDSKYKLNGLFQCVQPVVIAFSPIWQWAVQWVTSLFDLACCWAFWWANVWSKTKVRPKSKSEVILLRHLVSQNIEASAQGRF